MENFPSLKKQNDGKTISIDKDLFSIGRSLNCDHTLESLGVSRFHAIIKKEDNKWILYDRSTNGTVVNSKEIKFNESTELKNGDTIKLGPEDETYIFTLPECQSKIPETMVIDEQILEEFEKPLEIDTVPTQEETKSETTTKEKLNQNLDMMENELTCSICSELFIKAVTLNCSHTFCKYCLEQWKKNKSNCPICRAKIKSVSPTLVLDNFIEKFISTQDKATKEARKSIVQKREEIAENTACSSVQQEDDDVQIVDTWTDYDEDSYYDEDNHTDWSDSDMESDNDDGVDVYVSSTTRRGRNRPYYGGYGNCYICHQPGHWANSCPLKIHR